MIKISLDVGNEFEGSKRILAFDNRTRKILITWC